MAKKKERRRATQPFFYYQVQKAVEIAIRFYNEERPHMSLDGMTPREAATRTGEINKKWISYREKAIKAKVV